MSRESALTAQSDELVEQYAKTFGVSSATARQRLATQRMAPGVGEILTARWGDAITEVWFDNEVGEWVVAATRDVPSEGVAQQFREDGLEHHYRLQRVAYDRQQLAEAGQRLGEDLSDIVRQGDVQLATARARAEVTVSSDIDSEDQARVTAAIERILSRAGFDGDRLAWFPSFSHLII